MHWCFKIQLHSLYIIEAVFFNFRTPPIMMLFVRNYMKVSTVQRTSFNFSKIYTNYWGCTSYLVPVGPLFWPLLWKTDFLTFKIFGNQCWEACYCPLHGSFSQTCHEFGLKHAIVILFCWDARIVKFTGKPDTDNSG